MATLPHGDKALVDLGKIEDYCLDPLHPRGRHKARVFQSALGLRRSDSAWLRRLLLDAAGSEPAVPLSSDDWGSRWQLDLDVFRSGKHARIRTLWIVRLGEETPRFVTCWVL